MKVVKFNFTEFTVQNTFFAANVYNAHPYLRFASLTLIRHCRMLAVANSEISLLSVV